VTAAKEQRASSAKVYTGAPAGQEYVDHEAIKFGRELHEAMMRKGFRYVFGEGEK
jgi:hypothetical protein